MSTPHSPTMSTVVVIGGGPLSTRAIAAAADATVIAADSGLDHALAAGLQPSLLVGDLDSISESGLAWAQHHGVDIERHPVDKDLTDTELALEVAARYGTEGVLVMGGVGDRLDHLLGTIVALGRPSLAAQSSVSAWLGDTHLHVACAGRTVHLDDPPGTTFSVLSLHGEATGVSVTGARWSLADATLPAGSALGVSNVVVDAVEVRCAIGVLTVVVPA
jgi:thiamine pyrophosphokinase